MNNASKNVLNYMCINNKTYDYNRIKNEIKNSIKNRLSTYIKANPLELLPEDKEDLDIFDELTSIIIIPKYQYILHELQSKWNKSTNICNITACVCDHNDNHIKLICCLKRCDSNQIEQVPYIWFDLDSNNSNNSYHINNESYEINTIVNNNISTIFKQSYNDGYLKHIKSYENMINILSIIKNDIEFTNSILIPELNNSFMNCDVSVFYNINNYKV